MFGKKNKKQDVNASQQSESAVSAAAPDVKTKAKKKQQKIEDRLGLWPKKSA